MLASVLLAASLGTATMAAIPGGEFRPLYLREDAGMVEVAPFRIDTLPVTNRDFLAFVQENPRWSKSRIPAIFADGRYLQHWQVDTGDAWRPSDDILDRVVVNVSWFAAQAYCASRQAELPTVAQWEFVARASETRADGGSDPAYRKRILEWYTSHRDPLASEVGHSPQNYWGVKDMHGLVWEWTRDFSSALTSGESRADSAVDTQLYCASGSVGAADPSDYAAFMRYGFRSSLEAAYSLPNLGFRCAAPHRSAQ